MMDLHIVSEIDHNSISITNNLNAGEEDIIWSEFIYQRASVVTCYANLFKALSDTTSIP
jgi:hypothetical protein